jgi:lysophospholipase L1-like esterase
MRIRHLSLRLLVLVLVLVQFAPEVLAQRPEQWVSSWASAQQERRVFGRGGRGQADGDGSLEDQTVRMMVRTSIGGSPVRVWLSNVHGGAPLTIGSARIALHAEGSRIVSGSDRALTFNGMSSVTIPPGAPMVSDPVDLEVAPLTDLAISLYLPENTGSPTTHAMGLRDAYVSEAGDFTGAAEISGGSTMNSWYWVSAVDVLAPGGASVIVAFGDSITDGATSTPGTNGGWPSVLAERLSPLRGIVNMGISGNRLLADGAGVSALARFDRDVLGRPGVGWVMIMEGINDIGATARGPAPEVTSETLIGALGQMAARAHARGIKVIACTLTPYEGAGYYSESGEVMRQAVNEFIRTSPVFDAVVDFDAVIRDPENPLRFLPEYTNGDNLHPNDAGYRAMGESIDLSIFQ